MKQVEPSLREGPMNRDDPESLRDNLGFNSTQGSFLIYRCL